MLKLAYVIYNRMSNERFSKRFKTIIDYYGSDFFKDKKVLDIGPGAGEFAIALAGLGAHVTAVDGRKNNLDYIKSQNASIKIIKANLDQEWPFKEQFDLVLHLGTLNHLTYVKKHLDFVCRTAKHIVLDTLVCDSLDPGKCPLVRENKNNPYSSLSGTGARPSPAMVEDAFSSHNFSYECLNDSRCNTKDFVYDWVGKNTGTHNSGISRIWFARANNVQAAIGEGKIPSKPQILTRSSLGITPVLDYKDLTSETKPNLNKNPRVAVCFSGHLRSIQKTFPFLKNYLITPNNADVFISTWDTVGFDKGKGDASTVSITTSSIMDWIFANLRPTQILVEKLFNFNGEKYRPRSIEVRDPNNVLGMYYKIQSANRLKTKYEKDNKFKYDFVIRCRFDITLDRPLIVSSYLPSKLYLPDSFRWGKNAENDKIAFGSSDFMDKYSNVFDNIDKYYEDGCVFHPETILGHHVSANKMPIERIAIPYMLHRANGNAMRI